MDRIDFLGFVLLLRDISRLDRYSTQHSQPVVGYEARTADGFNSTRDGVADLYTFSPDSFVDGDTDLGNYTLPEANVLNVTVVDGNGDPVEDARVSVRHWEASHGNGSAVGIGYQTTNVDGQLVLRGAANPGIEVTGNVTIDVKPPEGATRFIDETQRFEPTVTEDSNLEVDLAETDRGDGTDGGDDTDEGDDGGGDSDPSVTAVIDANRTGIYPGDTVQFNASASEGDTLDYEWTFDDGTSATGETAERTYDATGTYNVTLTVSNQSASDTEQVTVSVVEPVEATITAEQTSGAVGEIIEFDALDSTSEDRRANVTYEWDFGDGTTLTDGVVAHEYDTAGTYTVTLTATDTVTGETTTDEVEVVIEESGTDDEVPGFGPLVTLIALLVSALVARSRD
jgi:PGF-CTERM protein